MKTKIIFILLLFLVIVSSCKKDYVSSEKVYRLEGHAQKGPFISGANVTIIELDKNLVPTGKSYFSTIDDNAGHFTFPEVKFNSNYIQLKVEGNYYDEVLGGIPINEITLYSIVDISKDSIINVNLLTHIEQSRVQFLLDKGISFQNAQKQAQNELLKVFNLEDKGIGNAEQLDITSPNLDGGVLLLISSIIISNYGTGLEFQEFISNFVTDFKEDGTIDSESIQEALATGAYVLDVNKITTNLTTKYSDMGKSIKPYEINLLLNQFLSKTKFHNRLSSLFPDTVYGAINLLTLPDSTRININLNYCIAINSTDDFLLSNASVFLTSDYNMNFSASGVNWYPDGNTERVGIDMQINKSIIIPFSFSNSGQVFIEVQANCMPFSPIIQYNRNRTIFW